MLDKSGFINLAKTKRINLPVTGVYLSGEEGYFAAYSNHLKVVKRLKLGSAHHRDAYYTLLVAIECYLKDIFCIARFFKFGDLNQAFNVGGSHLSWMADKVRSKTIDDITPKNRFGHDLYSLSDTLQKQIQHLHEDLDFDLFRQRLPKNEGWIDDRYRDPKFQIKTNFTAELNDLLNTFTQVQKKHFGGLK